jgi:hypothetical protein
LAAKLEEMATLDALTDIKLKAQLEADSKE